MAFEIEALNGSVWMLGLLPRNFYHCSLDSYTVKCRLVMTLAAVFRSFLRPVITECSSYYDVFRHSLVVAVRCCPVAVTSDVYRS